MLEALYDAIRRDAPPAIVETPDGRMYTDKDIRPVLQPSVYRYDTHTLSSIVDYCHENPNGLDHSELIISVVSPTEVLLTSTFQDAFRQTLVYVRASAYTPEIPFGRYREPEEFTVILQSMFAPSEDRDRVLRYVGNIKQVNEADYVDDGVTQSVTVRSGAASLSKEVLPSPVVLRPYRTFSEIEQPDSAFVFRVSTKEGLHFMLAEADAGAWRHDAVCRIRDYFKERLPKIAVIA